MLAPGAQADPDIRPWLDPSAELFIICDDVATVALRFDQSLLQLRGARVADLLLSLDGRTSIRMLCADYGESNTLQVLAQLEAAGFLQTRTAAMNLQPSTHPRTPSGIELLDPFNLGAEGLAEALDAEARTCAPLRIVLTDSLLRVDARDPGASWLVVCPGPTRSWISPVFRAGSAPCWTCFRRRLAAQDDALAIMMGSGVRPLHRISRQSVLTRAAAHDIARAIAGACDGRQAAALSRIDHQRRSTSRHVVAAYPTCGNCGPVPSARRRLPKRPDDLWNRVGNAIGHLIDPVTGISTDLGVRNAASDDVVRVAVARYADPSLGKLCAFMMDAAQGRIVRSAARLRTTFGSASNDNDARAKAILESFERYSSIFQGDEPRVRASPAEFGAAAIEPWPLRSVDRTDGGESVIGACGPIDWSPVVSLSGTTRYVPTACCYDGFRDRACINMPPYTSNGTAISFSREDAIVRGFLELVERDAISIWWYNRAPRPVLSIESFADELADGFTAQLKARGRDLVVFDTSSDIGVCVFTAMSRRPGNGTPLFGFGAHFDARQALIRALTELGQALCFEADESRKWRSFSWADQRHLVCSTNERRQAEHYPGVATQPTARNCADLAERAGSELFINDRTRDDIGLPVVRVFVPGLCMPGRRRGSGRLFEVPVKLGWRDHPIAAGDINPCSLPM